MIMFRACVFLTAAVLLGCGDAAPVRTTLSALKASQLDFHGQHVLVSGTLRTFDSPRHYWIENDHRDRVAVVTDEELAPLVGQTIDVSGIFIYDPNEGRRIEAIELRPIGSE